MQRSPSSSSSSSSIKIKTLIQNFIISELNRVTRVLAKAKPILIEIIDEIHLISTQILVPLLFKKNRNKNKLYIASFRFHYSSNSSLFVPQSSIQNGFKMGISGYLHWLEEKNNDDGYEIIEINEIDELAENFIANCHEKFLLEKQESERKFQEMMARSL
ncbi:hypothetical protein SSX86_013327 [Deinandra increscens subsp. villosa]|uniref:Uncharacterized protein n=1 Tax=Deinandra increscens subsp. villosa TaxID=3103831 RepID=A0AAP0H1H6_9ASTR